MLWIPRILEKQNLLLSHSLKSEMTMSLEAESLLIVAFETKACLELFEYDDSKNMIISFRKEI